MYVCTCGKLPKRARVTCVGISAKEDLPGAGVSFLCEGDVADTLVVRVGLEFGAVLDVVEVL